jgi:hypothetical protein
MSTYGELADFEAWRPELPRETKIRTHFLDILEQIEDIARNGNPLHRMNGPALLDQATRRPERKMAGNGIGGMNPHHLLDHDAPTDASKKIAKISISPLDIEIGNTQ